MYDALFRLRSTTITTDIQSGGERETRAFRWIDGFRILTKENKTGSRVMQGPEITLNDWTFRAPVKVAVHWRSIRPNSIYPGD
jgi:hypothetical protein